MFALIREALSLYIIKTRIDTLNQACYGAVSYADEQRLKNPSMTPEEVDAAIVRYLQEVLPGIKNADIHLDRIRSSMIGAGADPEKKL